MDNRTKGIEIAVGLFVLVCLAVAVTMFSIMLQKENAFDPRITVSAVFENARGLRPGAPVWVSGISVGSVKWVGFDDGDRAKVIMSLLSTAQRRVHRNAVARIVPMSLVGADTMIMLAPGTSTVPLIADGDVLNTEEMPDWYDFVDTAAPSLDHLNGLLANLEDLTSTAVASKGALEESLTKAANIVDAVESGHGTLGALITDRTVYDDAVRLVAASADAAEEIREVAAKAKESSEMLPETLAKAGEAAENARTAAADLVVLIDDAESVVSNADEFIDDLKAASGDVPEITRSSKKIAANIEAITKNLSVASDGVPALVEASREGVEEATGVMEAAKSTWLLRSYFPKKEPDTSVTIDRREGITPSR